MSSHHASPDGPRQNTPPSRWRAAWDGSAKVTHDEPRNERRAAAGLELGKTYIFAATTVFAIGSAMYFFGGAALAVIIPATVLTGFGLSGVLTSMYNYTAVAFPTRVRATGITVTDGVGHIAATFGALVAGAFFTATAASNYVGWFLWITVAGALLPGALLFFLGNRQSKAVWKWFPSRAKPTTHRAVASKEARLSYVRG